MLKLQIELPDDLGKYVEFMSPADLNLMFTDMLRQRINGETQPVVTIVNQESKPSFNEDMFFSRLEAMLADHTVMSATSQPKSKEEIKQTFKEAVITAAPPEVSDSAGDEVITDFLANIFK